MPFLLAEILNFQGSTHRIGVGSFSNKDKRGNRQWNYGIFMMQTNNQPGEP